MQRSILRFKAILLPLRREKNTENTHLGVADLCLQTSPKCTKSYDYKYASFAYLDILFQKACKKSRVLSNQLGKLHGDSYQYQC